MTLDENIQKAEKDAKMAEFDTEWGRGNYFIDRAEALEYAKNCRQLAEWLKELQAHREAWGKAKRTVKAYLMLEGFGSAYQDDIEKLIDGCIPKEGDAV